ncbi:MAG: hypothetical protein WA639_09595 [Candidatus Acidiferrum sp.]
MSSQLSFGFHPKRITIFVIAVAAFSIVPASSARGNTTWTITVDVAKSAALGSDFPYYTVQSSPPNAPDCSDPSSPPRDLGDLYVCAGDKIQWTPNTTGKAGWLTIHQRQGFLPAGGNPSQWFRAREKKYATVTTDAGDFGAIYEYCIAVHDDKGRPAKLYTHDPKIIIGGARLEVLIQTFQKLCRQLPAALNRDHDPDVSEETRKRAVDGCSQFQEIKNLMK